MNKKTKPYRVFLSSTSKDLKDYCIKVKNNLEQLYSEELIVSYHEYWAATGNSPLEYCKEQIDNSDLVLTIIGGRYGSTPNNHEHSFTELECLHAIKQNIKLVPLLVDTDKTKFPQDLVKDADLQIEALENNELDKADKFRTSYIKLIAFRKWLETDHHGAFFDSKEKLVIETSKSVKKWLEECAENNQEIPLSNNEAKISNIENTFSSLEKDALIIVGSESIKEWESSCDSTIQKVLYRAPEHNLEPCYIEFDEEKTTNIRWDVKPKYRPIDPKCHGVICLMSEGVGYPLESDFALQNIKKIDLWTDTSKSFRLLHPWPKDQESIANALNKGCFPLTQAVFYFIEALNNNKPVQLFLIVDDEKKQQIQLTNFISAINDYSTKHIEKISRDKLRFSVRQFVANIFQIDIENPYLSLDYYDIDDADNYLGREKEVNEAIEYLNTQFDNPNETAVVRIQGASGCGKSSFLRAGLLAKLKTETKQCFYQTMVFRPTDFHNMEGLVDHVLEKLLTKINNQTDLNILKGFNPKGVQARVVKEVVEKLESLLNGYDAQKKLIIGIDQFEEIVDDLSSEQRKDAWKPLIQLIKACTKSNCIGFIYTLESSRIDNLENKVIGSQFFSSYHTIALTETDTFLKNIIQTPFIDNGYKLSDEIVKDIFDNAKVFKAKGNSVLPLLALKLTALYIEVRDKCKDKTQNNDEGLSTNFNLIDVEKSDLTLNYDLESELNELAKSAWEEVRGKDEAAEIKQQQLSHFLQPLVRTITGSDHLILETVGDRPYEDEKKIDESFIRHRLLVPAEGRFRLVHEAVLRRWSDAEQWLEETLAFLKIEAEYLDEAIFWNKKNREPKYLRISDTSSNDKKIEIIDQAASILDVYKRLWSLTNKFTMNKHDAVLKAYCTALFLYNKTPDHLVKDSSIEGKKYIHLAAQYGIKELLSKYFEDDKQSIELTDAEGQSPLIYASWAQYDTVVYLLEKGANSVVKCNITKEKDKEKGWNAIYSSIKMGRQDIFDLLLPLYSVTELNCYPGNQSVLHVCAQFGQREMAEKIMDKVSLDLKQKTLSEEMPLHQAAGNGQLEMFKYFKIFSDIRESDRKGWSALHLAARNGHQSIVEELLDNEFFTDCCSLKTEADYTPLFLSVFAKNSLIVEYLLQASDPNENEIQKGKYEKYTALHLAIELFQTENVINRSKQDEILQIIKILLKHEDTDPNLRCGTGKTPFAMASKQPKIIQLLLKHPRLDLNSKTSNGWTPLMFAIRSRDRETVEKLIAYSSVKVDHCATDGKSAGYLLVKNSMIELAEQLFEQGRINPWNTFQKQYSILAGLCSGEETDIKERLLKQILNFYPAKPNELEQKLLNSALKSIHSANKMIDCLFDKGANPNIALSEIGETHLHVAASLGEMNTFNKILENLESNPVIVDNWNRSPWDYAPNHLQDVVKEKLNQAIGLRKEKGVFKNTQPKAVILEYGDEESNNQQLIKAAEKSDIKRYKELLLSPYTNPTMKDSWGRSSTDFASDELLAHFEELLRQAIKRYKEDAR